MRTIRGKRDDTLFKCLQAYRTMEIKIGPALGIAICKSGFSFDLISGNLKISTTTLYKWIFGGAVPHRGMWSEINRLTCLLEIALESGTLPDVSAVTVQDEQNVLAKVQLKHGLEVNKLLNKNI